MNDAERLDDTRERACAKITQFEDSVPWMYLDKPGLVTVAVGRMLPDAIAAQELPFQSPAGGAATLQQIGRDFARVASMRPDQTAAFYRSPASVTLLAPDIAKLLLSVVSSVDTELALMFPRYASWPESARLAAIDMLYNLGSVRFREYHRMLAALDQEDFLGAARECGRNTADAAFAARNYWTRTSLLNAATAAKSTA